MPSWSQTTNIDLMVILTMRFYSSFVLLLFCFCRLSLTKTQNHGFNVELIHPISSRSPFYNPKETQIQRISSILNYSINRVRYLNHVFSFSPNKIQDVPLSSFMGAGYVMSYSIGDLGVDTLTLNSNNGTPISFKNIVIGCGHRNQGPLEGYVSGNIGLARGPLSFISQLNSSIGGKFSYCLVPLFSKENVSSKLHFGDKSTVSGLGTVSTPIKEENGYFVSLEAFSVGDHIIKLENSDNRGNSIIDSGTTMTILPKDVYSRLESVVLDMVKLKRVKDPSQQFNLCYQTTSTTLLTKVLIITAHFSGSEVHLNALNTFYPITDEVICFAFVSGGNFSSLAIFGNVVQQNFLVGFDLNKKTISFKPTDCTKH
ncbi:putative nepenthesin [Medicago truncatula]|uniref:Putative nepenthesin n=1 Tax=Medicago truncatula TaxID=3880 RepID=A0A396HXW8_MEDTR|nr:putative nepenthesin [Medicago truncatula]